MKVALYCRVSTEEQAQGFSIDHQKERMAAYCLSQGWSDYELFVDEGYSGTNLNRPHLKRLMENVRDETIQVVLVYKLDRLSRRQKDVLHLLEDIFEPHHAGFRSVTEPFDTSTPFGKAMIGMLAVFAQLERDTIIERTRAGKRERTRQGLWYGGPVPYGYVWSSEKQTLLPNPSQAELIRELFRQFIAGKSYQAIARYLNARTNERLFSSHKTLAYILTNPVYVGKLNYSGEVVHGQHEPLVDEDTWSQAQNEMKQRHSRRAPYGKYLLSNLLVCGACGSPLKHIRVKDRRSTPIHWRNYYLCSAKHKGLKCPSRYYPEKHLEDEVIHQLKKITMDRVLVENEILKWLQHTRKDPEVFGELKANLAEVNRRLERWYEAFEQGYFDTAQAVQRLRSLEQERSALRLRLGELEASQTESKQVDSTLLHSLSSLSQQWDHLSNDEHAAILRAAVQKITVHPDGSLDVVWNT